MRKLLSWNLAFTEEMVTREGRRGDGKGKKEKKGKEKMEGQRQEGRKGGSRGQKGERREWRGKVRKAKGLTTRPDTSLPTPGGKPNPWPTPIHLAKFVVDFGRPEILAD